MSDPTPTEPTGTEPAEPTPGPEKEPEKGAGGKDAILADLAKERDKRQALEAKLAEYEDAQKTEAEKAAERLTTAERTAAEASARALRYEAAAEAGLPLNMAARLRGDTKEELLADAEELKGLVGTPGSTFGGSADAGVRKTPPQKVSPNDLLRAAIRGD